MYEDGIETNTWLTEIDGRLSAVEEVLKTHGEEIHAIKSEIKEMFSFLRKKLGGDLPFRISEKEVTIEDKIHISHLTWAKILVLKEIAGFILCLTNIKIQTQFRDSFKLRSSALWFLS